MANKTGSKSTADLANTASRLAGSTKVEPTRFPALQNLIEL
jgi:hypothetical protein